MYRVLIVDDEPLARRRIRRLLQDENDMQVAGECATGAEAVVSIRELAPDLVFLDVQMPEMDGLEVIRAVGVPCFRALVFVTAYEQYAVQAFEAEAVDYLLKPFDRQRFQDALQRVRRRLTEQSQDQLNHQIQQLVSRLGARSPYLQRLVIKGEDRILLVNVDDVDWLEAAGNYVCVHMDKRSHIVRDTLSRLEGQLDPEKFLRIHRSAVVNLGRIRELRPSFSGEYKIILRTDDTLPLSRRHREELMKRLGIIL